MEFFFDGALNLGEFLFLADKFIFELVNKCEHLLFWLYHPVDSKYLCLQLLCTQLLILH